MPPNRTLMRDIGERLFQLRGYRDPSFFHDLPSAGSEVFLIQALCPLYESTLGDGDPYKSLTGRFMKSLEIWLNRFAPAIKIVYTNIQAVCHRKGDKNGKELIGGSAGCCDPKGDELKVLANVREIHFLCLRASGVTVRAIIASSNASISSFGVDAAIIKHFFAYKGTRTYKGVTMFYTPHPKFVSATCFNNKAVTLRIGGSLGDRLGTPSRILDGWAKIFSLILGYTGDAAVKVASEIYENVRKDTNSGATVREWKNRLLLTTTKETEARLKKELGKGGACHPPNFSPKRSRARALTT